MKSICVFLGSSVGKDPAYMKLANQMGTTIARKGLTLVYGGSSTGCMNELANAALQEGGTVIGVTVQSLKDKEQFHKGLTELHVVPTMHERKDLMVQLSDSFVAMPGGIGTFEEFFEVYTLRQLNYHSKPCAILDVNGFYAPLKEMMAVTEREGFLKHSFNEWVLWSESPVELVDMLIQGKD